MKFLIPVLLLASLHASTALKCHAQYGVNLVALAMQMKEGSPEKIPKKMLTTQDVAMECTSPKDVCAYAQIKDMLYLKSCTASCEDLKNFLPAEFEVTCCKSDMCNTGKSRNPLHEAIKKSLLGAFWLDEFKNTFE